MRRRARVAAASSFAAAGGAISAMTRPREVTRKRSPRRTLAMYSGSFCRSSVTLTCFMRASYVQMKCTDVEAAHQDAGDRPGLAGEPEKAHPHARKGRDRKGEK